MAGVCQHTIVVPQSQARTHPFIQDRLHHVRITPRRPHAPPCQLNLAHSFAWVRAGKVTPCRMCRHAHPLINGEQPRDTRCGCPQPHVITRMYTIVWVLAFNIQTHCYSDISVDARSQELTRTLTFILQVGMCVQLHARTHIGVSTSLSGNFYIKILT